MLSANYHREQARVLAALALSSKNPFQASLFTQAAREHMEQAQAPSDDASDPMRLRMDGAEG
jgi:hypothetical protein